MTNGEKIDRALEAYRERYAVVRPQPEIERNPSYSQKRLERDRDRTDSWSGASWGGGVTAGGDRSR
jgi:hypothetical protein